MSNFWFQPDATTNLRVIDLGDLAHEDVQQVINFVYTGSFRFRIKFFEKYSEIRNFMKTHWVRSFHLFLVVFPHFKYFHEVRYFFRNQYPKISSLKIEISIEKLFQAVWN